MSVVTYAPVELIHRRTKVAAFRYDGTPECREAIIGWSQGNCLTTAGANSSHTEFWVDSPEGRKPIHEGDHVICGVLGEWYKAIPALVATSYDELGHGSNLGLTDDQLRGLQTAAHATSDLTRIHEIVDQIVAAALDR